jgi:hypothetical protein
MKVAGVQELRAGSAALLGGEEPVIVTRRGKVSGLYVPLGHSDQLPPDVPHELARVLGRHLGAMLDRQGVTEAEVQEDFDAHRRRRRGR